MAGETQVKEPKKNMAAWSDVVFLDEEKQPIVKDRKRLVRNHSSLRAPLFLRPCSSILLQYIDGCIDDVDAESNISRGGYDLKVVEPIASWRAR